jgi:NAD(P)-dependent dehydrogenase (short-subunit alcohol dehydrogenase family)
MTVAFELSESVAVITGAGSGIGRASALAFARRGARVVVSDLLEDRAHEVAAAIVAVGGEAIGVGADVTDEASLSALRDAALAGFGRVDLIMNNAGVLAMGAPESLPDEAWQRVIDVNVMSVARSNRVFLPLLLEQKRGHVVITASASGLLAYGFDRLPYVASKHALVGVSEALALYLAPKGIGVTCLCPSGVATNIIEQISFYGAIATTPRAPEHAVVTADEVGESAADAVERGDFLVLTVPGVRDELVRRATDIEGYLQDHISQQSA